MHVSGWHMWLDLAMVLWHEKPKHEKPRIEFINKVCILPS